MEESQEQPTGVQIPKYLREKYESSPIRNEDIAGLNLLTDNELEEVPPEIRGKVLEQQFSLYDLTLDKIKLERELSSSLTDLVTSLPMTRDLYERLDEIEKRLKEIREGKSQISPDEEGKQPRRVGGVVIEVDLDRLHDMNKISRTAGDKFLRGVARALSSIVRRKGDLIYIDGLPGDRPIEEERRVVARLGGRSDEFVVILDGATIQYAKEVMKQAEENLKNEEEFASLTEPRIAEIGFSFSYGGSKYGLERNPINALEIADKKMQEQKAESKKRGEHVEPFFISEAEKINGK